MSGAKPITAGGKGGSLFRFRTILTLIIRDFIRDGSGVTTPCSPGGDFHGTLTSIGEVVSWLTRLDRWGA